MSAMQYLERLTPRTRRAFALGVGLALLVLALTIVAGAWFVRGLVRQQIAQRDAESLYATTLMEQLDARNGGKEAPLESDEQIGFDAAILASRLKGVMGIRFYKPEGRFADAFPATIQPQPLAGELVESLRRFEPRGRYRAATPLSDIFIYLPQFATGQIARVPTLEVTVPLHRREAQALAGVAQFIIEGQSIGAEYARLDRHLGGLAVLTFVAAGVLLALMLWPAFRRVEALNRELTERNEHLYRANQELALAVRSAALGAVSANLMHGLKNPLASLAQFVRQGRGNGSEPGADDWQDAVAAAHRMQSLVEQTLEVLADAEGQAAYEISVREVGQRLQERLRPLAQERGVDLAVVTNLDELLSSRVANLLGLVLANLAENAVQATPGGKRVTLTAQRRENRLIWEVRDEGPGFPAHLRSKLFLPCRSTREGGSGIGLAISKQVADHLGAMLELVEPASGGCTFIVSLPMPAAVAERRSGAA